MNRIAGWIVAFAAGLGGMSCSTPGEGATPGVGVLEGRAYFVGSVPGARIELHDYADGELGAVVAETVAGAGGVWRLEGNFPAGDYVVEAHLDGLSWRDPIAGTSGFYEPGDVLRAPALGYKLIEERRLSVTPYTTLAFAAGQSREQAGTDFAVADAQIAMGTHLTFSPVDTPVLDDQGGALTDAVAHALLIDAFVGLAGRASELAAVEPGTELTPPVLLRALLDDAAGPSVPGVFDGRGVSGEVFIDAGLGFTITDQTLRGDLALSLDALLSHESGPWADFASTAAAPIRRSIVCSASRLFPVCEGAPEDSTPPVFEGVDPPDGASIDGRQQLTVTVFDPESLVTSVEVRPVVGGASGELLPAPTQNGREWLFEVDTTRFPLQERLVLVAEATSEGGTSSQRTEYRLSNIGSALIEGVVSGGHNLRVSAYRVSPAGVELLAETTTYDNGAFEIELREWVGPVLLTASGHPQHPAGRSGFLDRARGAVSTWRTTDTLSTLIPHFDPAADVQPYMVISPLTDLAYARADFAATHGGPALVDSFVESVALLAEHFDIPDEVNFPLVGILPTPGDVPFGEVLSKSDHLALAEACLHQQALRVSRQIYPDALHQFTALDLLGAWRDDVGADGYLDGRTGAMNTVISSADGSIVLSDAFRGDLAIACSEWMDGEQGPETLATRHLVEWLQAMAVRVSALFNVDAHGDPEPFDDTGPTLSFEVISADPTRVRRKGDGWLAAGEITLRLTATDAAGLDSLEVVVSRVGLGGLREVVELDALVTLEDGTEAGEQLAQTLRWHATVDEVPPGGLTFEITAVDALGQMSTVQTEVEGDNAAPELSASPLAPGVEIGGRWLSRASILEFAVTSDDANPDTLIIMVDGRPLELDADGVGRVDVSGPAREQLELVATDRVGNTSHLNVALEFDDVPPRVLMGPSQTQDETNLIVVRNADDTLSIEPDGEAVFTAIENDAVINKLQTTWADPPVLAFRGTDLVVHGEGVVGVKLAIAIDVDGEHVTTLRRATDGDRTLEVELTAEVLGIDPFNNPPRAGLPIQITVSATDLAGNVRTLEPLNLELNVLPPPLLIEYRQPEGPTAVQNLSFENDSIAGLFGQGPQITIADYIVTNPHPTSVYLSTQGGDALVHVETGLRIEGQNLTESIDDLAVRFACVQDVNFVGGIPLHTTNYDRFGTDLTVDGSTYSNGSCEPIVDVESTMRFAVGTRVYSAGVPGERFSVGPGRTELTIVAQLLHPSDEQARLLTDESVQSGQGHWFYRRPEWCNLTPNRVACRSSGFYEGRRLRTLTLVGVQHHETEFETSLGCWDDICEPDRISNHETYHNPISVETLR